VTASPAARWRLDPQGGNGRRALAAAGGAAQAPHALLRARLLDPQEGNGRRALTAARGAARRQPRPRASPPPCPHPPPPPLLLRQEHLPALLRDP